ncbi:MAG TPA: thiamine-binding protein [Spirochaetia bacterium]|nr:thiamine-binding protein [Spirochaetia bacterium]
MTSAMAIQCLPLSAASRKEAYAMVDAAIRIIEGSGLDYTVGPFETVVEGPVERLFPLAEEMHKAMLDAGGAKGGVATYMKIFSGEDMGSSEEKTGKYRAVGH